jgi:hypothetical protein
VPNGVDHPMRRKGDRFKRTPDHHPMERVSDRSRWTRFKHFWFGERRLYRDIWLFIISGLVLLGVNTNSNTLDQIQESRKTNTEQACLTRNDEHRAIRRFVLAQSQQALPITPEYNQMPESVKNYLASLAESNTDNEDLEEALDREFPIESNCREFANRAIEE